MTFSSRSNACREALSHQNGWSRDTRGQHEHQNGTFMPGRPHNRLVTCLHAHVVACWTYNCSWQVHRGIAERESCASAEFQLASRGVAGIRVAFCVATMTTMKLLLHVGLMLSLCTWLAAASTPNVVVFLVYVSASSM